MSQYIKKYYIISPRRFYKLKELQMNKTKGEPADVKVPKQIQDFKETQVLNKNIQDEFLESAGNTLQKLGVVNQTPAAQPLPASKPASQPGNQPEEKSDSGPVYGEGEEASGGSDLGDLIQFLRKEASSGNMGSRMSRLATALASLDGVNVTGRHISVDNKRLEAPTVVILDNLARAEKNLISDSIYMLLFKLPGDVAQRLVSGNIVNNREAIEFLNNPMESEFGKAMLGNYYSDDDAAATYTPRKGSGLTSNKSSKKIKGWTDLFQKKNHPVKKKKKK